MGVKKRRLTVDCAINCDVYLYVSFSVAFCRSIIFVISEKIGEQTAREGCIVRGGRSKFW